MNEIETFEGKIDGLEDIMLREISPTQNHKIHMFSFICRIKINKYRQTKPINPYYLRVGEE
jgi:hypothetical protein